MISPTSMDQSPSHLFTCEDEFGAPQRSRAFVVAIISARRVLQKGEWECTPSPESNNLRPRNRVGRSGVRTFEGRNHPAC